MQFKTLLGLAASVAISEAASLGSGFNYGSTTPSGVARQVADFEALFKRAQQLNGPTTFNSARLYTMIQDGTTNTPISAIEAAINTQTTLLLGIWASGGQTDVTNEIAALTSAISTYGSSFTDLVVGLSVGSEDLYRDSVTGVENKDGVGATPDTIVSYINQVKSAISGTAASGFAIGHVDTWNAWTNSSNSAVVDACDWLGVDEYPYYQYQDPNDISDAKTLFWNAYNVVKDVAGDKEVFITESGWPVSGPNEGEAVASIANAETYWQEIACALFGHYNTWWFTIQDADSSTTPSPSFGIIGADLSSAPLYNLQCNASASNASVTATSVASSVSSTSTTTGTTGKSTGTGVASTMASASGTGAPYPSGNGTGYTATGTPSAGSSATGSAATGTAATGTAASGTGSTASASATAAHQTGAANAIGYASSAAVLAIFGAVLAF